MDSNEAMVGYRIWAVDNVVYGPVELPMLVEWIREERVTADTWVYCEADNTWRKAADVQELRFVLSKLARAAVAGQPGSPESGPLVPGIKPGALRRVKILADMTDQQLGRFAQVMEVETIRQWTQIVKQGSPGDAMYMVLGGEVRVRIMVGDKESILATLGAGDVFGEMALFDHSPRSADVVANKDTVVLKISAQNFDRLVSDAPDLAAPFLLALCRTLAVRIRADDKRHHDAVAFARAAR